MHIKRTHSWEIPEHLATPEGIFLDRRRLLGGAAGLAAASLIGTESARAASDPTGDLYPAKRNEAYTLDRPLTPERAAPTRTSRRTPRGKPSETLSGGPLPAWRRR